MSDKLNDRDMISIDCWYVRKLMNEFPHLAKYFLDGAVCKGRRMYWPTSSWNMGF